MTIDEIENTLNKQSGILSGNWYVRVSIDLNAWHRNTYNVSITKNGMYFSFSFVINNNTVCKMSSITFAIMEITNKMSFDNISNIYNYLVELREELNNDIHGQ